MDDGNNEIPGGYRRRAFVPTPGQPLPQYPRHVVNPDLDGPFADPGKTWEDYAYSLALKYRAKPLGDWTDPSHPVNSSRYSSTTAGHVAGLRTSGDVQPATPFITRAPFMLVSDGRNLSNTPLFRSEEGVDLSQEAPITRFINTTYLARKVFQHLTYTDLLSLGMTRSVNYKIIGKNMACWDVSNGEFGRCNLTEEQLDTAGLTSQGCPSEVMATTSRATDRQSHGDMFEHVVQLLRATHLCQNSIQMFHLHRIPFVHMRVVESLLAPDNLPNLRELGIFNCEMLHFGHTVELLDILQRRQAGPSRRLDFFDFFPRYHEGPDDVNRQGSFGVSWNDTGVDTNAAVFSCLAFHIQPRCAVLGLDMTGNHTSFRRWLEKLPLDDWALPRVIGLGCPPPSNPDAYLADLYRIMAYGNPRLAEPEEFARDRWCSCCFTLLPVYLMHSNALSMCAGCALRLELDCERDHYKQHKQTVVDVWTGLSGLAAQRELPSLADLVTLTGPSDATVLLRRERAATLAREIDMLHNISVQERHLPALFPAEIWTTARQQRLLQVRIDYCLQSWNWPDLGRGDWLQHCPQTEHVLEQSPPITGDAILSEMLGYTPACDWDKKHMRHKPNASGNSQNRDREADH